MATASVIADASNASTNDAYVCPRPDDVKESSRLDIQHETWLRTFSGALIPSAISLPPNPKVLDIGCGQGVWARAFATAHPDSTVTGVDVDPPEFDAHTSPVNCTFEQADVDKPWEYDQEFDLIHARLLTVVVRDWPKFFERCWKSLKPGGWIETDDLTTPYAAENPKANMENSVFLRMSFLQEFGRQLDGIDTRAPLRHQDRLKIQGFVNTNTMKIKWPVGTWPGDSRERDIGELVLWNWRILMSRVGAVSLVKDLDLDHDVAKRLVDCMFEDIERNGSVNKYYFPMVVSTAQKPSK